jgi:curved DNA-binding protein CbpA
MKTLYDVLGVTERASPEEIRVAYRRLAQRFHPDRNEEAEAEARFKSINAAYVALMNEYSRRVYDDWLRRQRLALARESREQKARAAQAASRAAAQARGLESVHCARGGSSVPALGGAVLLALLGAAMAAWHLL